MLCGVIAAALRGEQLVDEVPERWSILLADRSTSTTQCWWEEFGYLIAGVGEEKPPLPIDLRMVETVVVSDHGLVSVVLPHCMGNCILPQPVELLSTSRVETLVERQLQVLCIDVVVERRLPVGD